MNYDDKDAQEPQPSQPAQATPTSAPVVEIACSPRNTGQVEWCLTPPEEDPVERLVALQDRLRREAHEHHGRRQPKMPRRHTNTGRSLRARLAREIKTHGAARCEQVLRWQHARWLEDPGWATARPDAIWSPGAMELALSKTSGPRPQAAPDAPDADLNTIEAQREILRRMGNGTGGRR